jgi:tetratricopeptide (TPR) repeat protein
MRQRLLIAGAAAAIAAAALSLGDALRGGGSVQAAAPPAPRPALSDAALSGAGAGTGARSAAETIAQLQIRLRANPGDARSYGLLGLAYEQRARETGDPTYYPKADGVLHRALALAPNNLVATSGLASLALSRHRFREALALGRKALRISPTTALTYGIVGDALVELGRYDAAFRAFDRMAGLKPGVASYSRVAYGRELLGQTSGAVQAMRLAVDAATSEREPTAWTHWQLGKLYWSYGRLDAAEHEYRASLAVFPGYVYALDALAQVEAARGQLPKAIALERRAVDRIPLPQFVGSLGDLYRATGRPGLARQQYGLVSVIQRLLVANGVKTDLETALFDIDHGIRLRHALALARRAHADRPSIDGDDVLAWALARNGRCAEALGWSRQALRLGTRDALKLFHRGMIERCLGHRTAARAYLGRALAINPHFSILWAPVARKALR